MTTSAYSRSLLVLALCSALPACQDARRAVGYEKSAPDEFQIIQRAPLSMPPDFTLRPPAPGMVRPQEGTPSDQAKSALLGTGKIQAVATVGRDSSDIALLKRAGVDSARKDIRDLVDKESLAQAKTDQSFTEKVMFWKPKPGEMIDPTDEDQRLHGSRGKSNGSSDAQPPQAVNSSAGSGPSSSFMRGLMEWLMWPADTP